MGYTSSTAKGMGGSLSLGLAILVKGLLGNLTGLAAGGGLLFVVSFNNA